MSCEQQQQQQQPQPQPEENRLSSLVKEVESNSGINGSLVLRLESLSRLNDFSRELRSRVGEHNEQLEHLCSKHYEGFVESVGQLLLVKEDAGQLQRRLEDVSGRVGDVCGRLSGLCGELVRCQQTLQNLLAVRRGMQLCLPVLETYALLRRQLRAERYYHALKTLERLQHSLVPLLPDYHFVEAIRRELPRIKEEIRLASENRLKDYLMEIRGEKTAHVGAVAMRQAMQRAGLKPEASEESEARSVDDQWDFKYVYHCLNIHSVLGEKAKFEQHYRNQRSYQCASMLQLPQAGKVNYGEFLSQIVGFFVIEDNLHHAMPELASRRFLTEQWENAAENLTRFVHNRLQKFDSTDSVLELKNYFCMLAVTMQSYGYSVAFIHDLIKEMQAKYFRLLHVHYRPAFKDIFADDNYTAMLLNNEEEYQAQVLDLYPYQSVEFNALPYPKRISFSQMVPLIYFNCLQFVDECMQFSVGAAGDSAIGSTSAEQEDSLSKAVNDLLAGTVRECFKERLSRLGLPELIQMIVNVEALEDVCDRLEAYLADKMDSQGGVKLHGKAVFKGCQAECESYAYEKMKEQVDKMMALAEYEWEEEASGEAPAGPRAPEANLRLPEPSAWVSDLMAYLRSTFTAFTNLPPKVAQTACLISCKHVHEQLLDMVLDHQLRAVSHSSLLQLSSDVNHCKQFAINSPVPGLEPETLCMAFEELSQLLRLVTSSDWRQFINECQSGKRVIYDRVTVSKAAQLLEKVHEFDKRRRSFLSNLRTKRETDAVLKQLRSLVPNAGNAH